MIITVSDGMGRSLVPAKAKGAPMTNASHRGYVCTELVPGNRYFTPACTGIDTGVIQSR
jgi:hypothetical protein